MPRLPSSLSAALIAVLACLALPAGAQNLGDRLRLQMEERAQRPAPGMGETEAAPELPGPLSPLPPLPNASVTSFARRIGGLETMMWRPARDGAYPVIVFSHGFGGCPTYSRALLGTIASAGYVVIAPEHSDAACSRPMPEGPEIAYRKPEHWSDATHRNRGDEIVRVLNALKFDVAVAAVVKPGRVALAGHGLGGYAALGLAGAWASWPHPAVEAVLALSPYVQPLVLAGQVRAIKVPVMFQGGTRDIVVTPAVRQETGAYDRMRAPAVYVEFAKVGHLAWTDFEPAVQQEIATYAIHFLDATLKGADWKFPTYANVTALRVK